jgi:hypothetical protein
MCRRATGVGGTNLTRYDKAIADAKTLHQSSIKRIKDFMCKWHTDPCCSIQCCRCFTYVEIEQAYLAHIYAHRGDKLRVQEWLHNQVLNSCTVKVDPTTLKNTISQSTFKVLGRDVCPALFKCVYKTGNSTVSDIRKSLQSGTMVQLYSLGAKNTRENVQAAATTMMNEFQDRLAAVCEIRPNNLAEDADFVTELRDATEISNSQMDYNEKRVFPCCYSWVSLYNEYLNENALNYAHIQDETGTFSYNHFRTTFKSRYPNIVFLSKDSTAFKCKICSALRTMLNGAIRQGDRLRIEGHIKTHTHNFRRAREHYANTIHRCILNFKVFKELSVVIDGMDQNKCLFPRLTNRYDLPQDAQIKFHLIGALVHGLGFQGHLFQSKKWTRCASDTNITVLVRTIYWSMKATGQTKLPDILHLQLDNCVKENKCNEFYAFLYYLVYIGAFKEIYASYCVVGHTHIDIDQVFSRLSCRLRKGHVTFTEFMAAMQDSYTYMGRKAEIERVEHVAHWGHAVHPHFVDVLNGITEPLLFKIHRADPDEAASTQISYKSHCEKLEWKGNLELLSAHTPMPWATEGNNDECLQCFDVTGIPDASGDEIMTRFNQHIKPNIDVNRLPDVRREWQSWADSEDAWALRLCAECSERRRQLRSVSTTLCTYDS